MTCGAILHKLSPRMEVLHGSESFTDRKVVAKGSDPGTQESLSRLLMNSQLLDQRLARPLYWLSTWLLNRLLRWQLGLLCIRLLGWVLGASENPETFDRILSTATSAAFFFRGFIQICQQASFAMLVLVLTIWYDKVICWRAFNYTFPFSSSTSQFAIWNAIPRFLFNLMAGRPLDSPSRSSCSFLCSEI